MADEFVDFYEALNLSLEADRKEVRRRINEVYLEAQRNLDHRNFQTRIKHQEMFEVVLPRARYILLDDGRRDDYDRLVRAFRGASAPVIAPPTAPIVPQVPDAKAFGLGDSSGFRLAEDAAGKAPAVEALPAPALDPVQMAMQRDEMWTKWKEGLEAAIARDESEPKPAKAGAVVSEAVPKQAPKTSEENGTARKPRTQASSISFNFGENGGNNGDDEESARATAFEIERQKTERKRAVVKELLASIGLKGAMMGGLGAAVPLGGVLIFLMGHYYPRSGAPQLPLPSAMAWFLGIVIVVGGSFFAATELSKSMRRQASLELSRLPLEELLRKAGRSY